MRVLRLMVSAERGGYRVKVTLSSDGRTHETATAWFGWETSDREREDLRWYFEDYMQFPVEPAPMIAVSIERRLDERGRELFAKVFGTDPGTIRLWRTVEPYLAETRIEVVTLGGDVALIPWELLRDPNTGTLLALSTQAFVRTTRDARPRAHRPATTGKIRVLLVICRPAGYRDVPFRSVASHLIRLAHADQEEFQFDVLRPPTFGTLRDVLREAAGHGVPYDVVHFDGHGKYADINIGAGMRGYLEFEMPGGRQYIDGNSLGELLAEAKVPVLVLNACRSAYAAPMAGPAEPGKDAEQRSRAYTSLAQEIADAGVGGVVAMRYNVYVVTAAQFVADLYTALAHGYDLGAAVSAARKRLASDPHREIAFVPRPFQDWVVPVVYETASAVVRSDPSGDRSPTPHLDKRGAASDRAVLDPALPADPDVGFCGRDETLLTLDRAFDSEQAVLLYGWAGAGKTSAAVEFARWYQLTGAVENGRVLFSSFARHITLMSLLDQAWAAYGHRGDAAESPWLTLPERRRREEVLRLLAQVPMLWIWDNVEQVAGFPAGNRSLWSADEQRELAEFLRDLRSTKVKVLLTSRRAEHSWLSDLLPHQARIIIPPMPLADRMQLARALASKRGRQLTDFSTWRPLLEFTQGNPLTIIVLVGQALHDGLRSKKEIEAFASRLRQGTAGITDEVAQGREKSLSAALNYGLEHAFIEHERVQLSLLHLFRDFLDVTPFWMMGNAEIVGVVPELSNLSRDSCIRLFDRATEIGLLTAAGEGYYLIHPALPSFFKQLFDFSVGPDGSLAAQRAAHAYAVTLAANGNYYFEQNLAGSREALVHLAMEESNLLHALEIARARSWWDAVMLAMQGLRALYQHDGRMSEFARLVESLVPDLVDPQTQGPRPGGEEWWRALTDYRAYLAFQARDFTRAERFQEALVETARRQAAQPLGLPPAALDDMQRVRILQLASALGSLGETTRQLGKPACAIYFEEDAELRRHVGDRQGESIVAFQLGHVYLLVPSLRDLDKAEHWYMRGLETTHRESLFRPRCLHQLGVVAYTRFQDATAAGAPEPDRRKYLRQAAAYCLQALRLYPASAVSDLASSHQQLGLIRREDDDAGAFDDALHHFLEAIRYSEAADDQYGAAATRFNVSVTLATNSRPDQALLWAKEALRGFSAFGEQTSGEMRQTEQLIAQLEQNLALPEEAS